MLIILVLTLYIACSEDVHNANNNSPVTEADAIQKISLLSPGIVTKAELTTHKGIKVWEVYMTASSGGELKIKYHVDDGTMVEIKDVSTSFEYVVEPGLNLVNYSVAKSVATNAKNGEIAGWKIGRD